MEEETPEPYRFVTDTVAVETDFLFSPTAVIPAHPLVIPAQAGIQNNVSNS